MTRKQCRGAPNLLTLAGSITFAIPGSNFNAIQHDVHTTDIIELLKLRVPHKVIAEKFGVTRSGLNQWMKSRAVSSLLVEKG